MDGSTFSKMLCEILNREADSIGMDDDFRSFPEWDSLALLGVLAMANSEFSKEISRAQFEKLVTVQSLFDFLIAKD